MSRSIFHRCIVLCLIVLIGFQNLAVETSKAAAPEPQGLTQSTAPLQVEESSSQSLVLKLTVPPFQVEQTVANNPDCQTIHIPEWGQSDYTDQAQLPIRGVLVGVLAGAQARITSVETGPQVVIDGFNGCSVSQKKIEPDLSKGINSMTEMPKLAMHAYAAEFATQAALAEITSTGLIRSQPVAQVEIRPFHYDPLSHKLSYFSWVRVRIDFEARSEVFSQTAVDEGPFEEILQNTLVNYPAVRNRLATPLSSRLNQPASTEDGPVAYKLMVSQDGMVGVTYAALQAAGVPVDDLDPRTFRLHNQGVEVAIDVSGEEDGEFNPGDSILFYGQKNTSRYTNSNIYWLTFGDDNGLRMSAIDGTPGTASTPITYQFRQHTETNTTYQTNHPSGTNRDRWYWNYVFGNEANQPVSNNYTVNLQHVSGSGSATIRGLFKGYSASPQHHTRIYLNNQLVKDDFWAAQTEYSFEVAISQSILLEGNNTIRVECPMDNGISQELIFVNWFEIDNARNFAADSGQTLFNGDTAGTWKYRVPGFYTNSQVVWDITNPLAPQQITNTVFEPSGSEYTLVFQQTIEGIRRYLASSTNDLIAPDAIQLDAPSNLHAATNEADYIIISHSDFLMAIQPLAAHYTSRGLRVAVVDVQDIFDEFNYGLVDANAIHNFLDYAYHSWIRPAPVYVLLVGDGTYDFKNFMGMNAPNYIPPYLAEIDPWMGETVANNRFVTVSGDDVLPDMALGLLPVKTAAETIIVVNKIITYPQTGTNDWTRKIAFVADKNDPAAGSFSGSSDAMVELLPPDLYIVDKIYYTITHPSVASVQQAIQNDFVDGRLIVHYAGHAAPYNWSNSHFFSNDNAMALANGSRLPFVISMTCLVGYYVHPLATGYNLSAIDESLVTAPNGGAIAAWAPTGLGLTAGHDLIDQGLFESFFNNGVTEIGAATTHAKLYLYSHSSSDRDLIDTYLLIGDPALNLPLAPTAVNLDYYTYSIQPSSGIELNWATVMEVNTLGFNLYRGIQPQGPFEKLNIGLIPAQNPGSPLGSVYTFLDPASQPGVTYYYKLEHVDNLNHSSTWGILTVNYNNLYLPILLR